MTLEHLGQLPADFLIKSVFKINTKWPWSLLGSFL